MSERDGNSAAVAALLVESVEELYENAPCGYLSTLPDGTFLRVNDTFLSWTGYGRADLLGRRRFQDLLTVGGRIFCETHFDPLLEMQGNVNEFAMEIVCANRTKLPALVNAVLLRDPHGRPLLVRTTIFNATDRREYERELRRKRKSAERAAQLSAAFISMMSHEIRTPLNAILGVGHLLEATELTTRQRQLAHVLRSSSESLLALLNDILDLSKIEAGKVTLDERAFDLRWQVQEIVDNFQLQAQEKRLTLAVEIDERLPRSLLGDPVKIGQVLTNLLSNALKFTAQGSVNLKLAVQEQSEETVVVELTITDTGIGIAKDRLPRVFEEFTQANGDIGRLYGGTGLGLTISQRLIEMHGSRITVASEPGKGTVFSFPLRLLIAPPESEVAGELNATAERWLHGMRVLVADDNAANLFVLSGLLRLWGVDLDVSTNGREAVERVREGSYDLVLMDLLMPELDGYAATRQIRAEPRFAHLPIFAISASDPVGQEGRLDAAGFTEFIGKPILPAVLFAKLARFAPHVETNL